MIFDPDDGYSNKKQRTDAASRKAPWVTGLNWERCNNVAEMLVFIPDLKATVLFLVVLQVAQ
jgi:hypothetical protein